MVHNACGRAVCVFLGICPIAGAAPPFTIDAIVIEGDQVPGVGAVTRIDNIAVNDKGEWIVEVDTDNPDSDRDSALIKNGAVFLREGGIVDVPTGGTLDGFDSVNLNNNGDSGWNLFLDDTGSIFTDSGIFFNDELIFQEGTVSQAPDFAPSTEYIGFFDAKINDFNGILVTASIDDPTIPSSVDRSLVVIQYFEDTDTYVEFVMATEGDVLPGQAAPIADFGTGPHQTDFDNTSDLIFVAEFDGGGSAIYRNLTLLAQTGAPSPIPGRNWLHLVEADVAINDVGGHAYQGDLEGDSASDEVLIKGGEVFAQEGAIGPDGFPIEDFGSSPRLNNAGEVLWVAVSDNDSPFDAALVLDDDVLVQEGITEVSGVVIDEVATGQDAFFTSRSGNYVILEGELADGRECALLITLCGADFNRDGALNILDFIALQEAFSSGHPRADINSDGELNILDFVAFQGLFQEGCPA